MWLNHSCYMLLCCWKRRPITGQRLHQFSFISPQSFHQNRHFPSISERVFQIYNLLWKNSSAVFFKVVISTRSEVPIITNNIVLARPNKWDPESSVFKPTVQQNEKGFSGKGCRVYIITDTQWTQRHLGWICGTRRIDGSSTRDACNVISQNKSVFNEGALLSPPNPQQCDCFIILNGR